MDHVPYSYVIGSLKYDMVCTQLDIAHVVGVLSRNMAEPRKEHSKTIKRVFKYLRGMIDCAIYYHGNYEEVRVHGFVDSDWDGDVNGRRSTSAYVFILFGVVVSWMNRK